MSKDQKNKEKLCGKNVDKLIMVCKMINEIRGGLSYWKFDQVWPINLYHKTLLEIVEVINQILFSNDFENQPKCPNQDTNKPHRSL